MTEETIYDALRESHEIQRSLCRELLNSPAGSDLRLQLFTQLRIELAAHAAAEERFLYAPMLMEDLGLDPSRHAMAEHHDIDELVEEMEETPETGGSWMAVANRLAHKVNHHLEEEEKKFFQISGKILTDKQKLLLSKRYRKDYARMHVVLAAK
jgi:hypothetical protein